MPVSSANRCPGRPRLRSVLLFLPLFATGCTALGIPALAPTRTESLKRMDPVRIQADTMGFADRFVNAMTGICDQLEHRAITPAAKDNAHQLKTDLALGAISDAVNPRPVAGLMDLVVLVRVLRQIAEDSKTTAMFGPDAADLVESLKRQESDLHSLARQYLTDGQLGELDQLADEWHRIHPNERSASHTHLADLPEANRPPAPTGKTPTSVFGLLFFDPTADLDPAVREIELSRATSERMFFYVQRLPLLLQLQAEGFYRQVLEVPEFTHALENVSTVADSTTRFADVSSRFTELVTALPKTLAEERQQTIKQVGAEITQQREASIRQLTEAVATQREAAIHELAAAVTSQRDAALTQATTGIATQRDLALQQLTLTLQTQQQAFVNNLEDATNRSLDRFVTRLALLAFAVLLLILAGSVLLRRSAARSAPPRPSPLPGTLPNPLPLPRPVSVPHE